jgi:hypothetical protein
MPYADAQHLQQHEPADDARQVDAAPTFCEDCGEPIAREGAECLNCEENEGRCQGCGAPLEYGDGVLTHCSVQCWRDQTARELPIYPER